MMDSTIQGCTDALRVSQPLGLGDSASRDTVLSPPGDVPKATFLYRAGPGQAEALRRHLESVLRKLALERGYEGLLGRDTKLLGFLLSFTLLLEGYFASTGYSVERYVFGAYAPSEEEPLGLRPYVEVHVRVQDARELIALWEGCLRYVAGVFGERAFQRVGLFLTRAV